MAYLFLAAAILCEVVGTLMLRVAATGRPRLYVAVATGYVTAFAMLAASLRHGMPLGVAYGIWTAAGVALTAVAARILFQENLNARMVAGLTLIAVGVLLVEAGRTH